MVEPRGAANGLDYPVATHLLHDVAFGLTEALPAGSGRDSASAAEAQVAIRVGEAEQALALADDLNSLDLPSAGVTGSPPDRWVVYGTDPWMVGLGRASDGTTILSAIRAQEALEAASSPMAETLGGIELASEWDPEGLLLDPGSEGSESVSRCGSGRVGERHRTATGLLLNRPAAGCGLHAIWGIPPLARCPAGNPDGPYPIPICIRGIS